MSRQARKQGAGGSQEEKSPVNTFVYTHNFPYKPQFAPTDCAMILHCDAPAGAGAASGGSDGGGVAAAFAACAQQLLMTHSAVFLVEFGALLKETSVEESTPELSSISKPVSRVVHKLNATAARVFAPGYAACVLMKLLRCPDTAPLFKHSTFIDPILPSRFCRFFLSNSTPLDVPCSIALPPQDAATAALLRSTFPALAASPAVECSGESAEERIASLVGTGGEAVSVEELLLVCAEVKFFLNKYTKQSEQRVVTLDLE